MKFKLVIQAIMLIGLSSSAIAADLAYKTALTNPFPERGKSGEPPTPVGRLRFDQGKAIWDLSSLPTQQSLIGNWKMIGYADISIYFAGMKNAYDSNGIRNEDRTFLRIKFGWEKNLPGQPEILFSKFSDWGARDQNQGPYECAIDVNSNSAVTSMYANAGAAKTYFRFDCRISQRSADELICALTLKVDRSDSIPQQQAALNNVLGGIAIFRRN